MKAALCEKYGSPDRIKVAEYPMPKLGAGEVLIKVMASAVNSGDVRIRGLMGNPITRLALRVVLGISKPRNPILGVALAGEIAALGENVQSFKIGDQVFAMTGLRLGGHAQYAVLKESSAMVLKPKSALYEEAAVLPFGGTTALHFLRKAGIHDGQQVMIYGASGSVGSSAVQIAKHFGVTVTAVCSGRNFEVVKALGADVLLDYKDEAYKKSEVKYDLIFDAVGKIKKAEIQGILKQGGSFISVAGYGVAAERKEDMLLLAQLYDEGKLKAVIDQSFPLEEISAAHRYVDQGIKMGNVAITVKHEE